MFIKINYFANEFSEIGLHFTNLNFFIQGQHKVKFPFFFNIRSLIQCMA